MLDNINPDGKQKEVLALPATGHTVVLGTAGSGKTSTAPRKVPLLHIRRYVLLCSFL